MYNKNKEKNKKDDPKLISIRPELLDSIASVNPEQLVHSDSCPPCVSESFDIAEILDGNQKKEKDKEYNIGNYLIKKTLGQGTFGKVKLGIYLPSQEKVAIKVLEKDRILEKDDEIRVKREFDMLALFNNPNVILVAEIFESLDSYYSVMEYCEGGELFNYIVKHRRLSEDEASFFYYQLISGLEYIHSLGIVHRDLKPENLLLTKDHLLKIIDFGLSNYFKEGQKELLVTPCGSPCYASPEMVAGKKYNGFKIDIWSSGIILYAMLCGYLPFEDKDNDRLFQKILDCKLEFPNYITDTSKDLIEKILVTDPDTRIDIPEIKKHPFFLKGKEIFEQEFSICQVDNNEKEDKDEKEDKEDKENKEDKDDNNDLKYYENMDINNILESSLLKSDVEKENVNEKNENIENNDNENNENIEAVENNENVENEDNYKNDEDNENIRIDENKENIEINENKENNENIEINENNENIEINENKENIEINENITDKKEMKEKKEKKEKKERKKKKKKKTKQIKKTKKKQKTK